MEFTKLTAYPSFPDQLTIIWDIDNHQLDGDYVFRIKMPGFLSENIYNKFQFKMPMIQLLSYCTLDDLSITCMCTPPRNDSYRNIEPFEKTILPNTGALNFDEFNIASEIVRKENMLFEVKIGIHVLVFKRKRTGQPCIHCVDEKTGTIKNSQCPYCFGTKYGYQDPVKVWSNIVEMPIDKKITEIGTTENKNAQARFTNEILLNKNDIILDEIDNVYWIVTVEPTIIKYRNYPISQQCILTSVSPKSIVNKLRG